MNKVSKSSFRYRGLTLVELLVVVSILVIVTAFTIPRLRVINKDRNMREAARIVGSAFSKASNRAIVEKSAGLLIERNPNYLDGSNVYFAGTRIFTLRALPPFGGDSEFDPTLSGVASNGANVIAPAPGFPNTMSVSVLTPLEHTSTNPMIQINDRIRLNYSSVTYLIVGVDPLPSGRLQLHLSLGLSGQAVMPSFPLTGATAPGLPYVVYRQPRKLQSSQTDLPDGYVIDLRYSGPMGLTSAGDLAATVFNQAVAELLNEPGNPDTVALLFNEYGGIERYGYTDSITGARQTGIPLEPFYFLLADFQAGFDLDPLFNPSSLWVTIDAETGSVIVSDNTVPPTGLTLQDRIVYARQQAQKRLSTSQ